MSPQMGVVTDADLAAAVAAEALLRAAADVAEVAARIAADNAHALLTITHGTVDDIADQTDIAAHTADPDAHHPEEIPEGRAIYGATTLLVIPGVISYIAGTIPVIADQIRYYPFYVRTPITINQLTYEITANAGAGNKCRWAIYEADTSWQPGALVVASAQVAIDAIAVVNAALAATVLQEGRYLLALTIEANATFRAAKVNMCMPGYDPLFGATLIKGVWRIAAAYAALPDPGTAWTTITDASNMFFPALFNVTVP